MAAANESQGLKIAVAAFVTLTVVLAVTTYFAYSGYSEASVKLADAEAKVRNAVNEVQKKSQEYDLLKQRVGYARIEDAQHLLGAIKKDNDKLAEQLKAINSQLKQMVAEYSQAGGDQQKVAELSQAADQIFTALDSLPEPNKTFLDTQNRLAQLLDDLAKLNTQVILDNETLRSNLKNVDAANAQQLQVQLAEARKANDLLTAEHNNHEQARQDLLRNVDEYRTKIAEQATQIANLTQQIAQFKDQTTKQRTQLLAQIREWREQATKQQDIMDTPDGRIVFVDYNRGEVRTDITRRQGAHERMQFSVFDRNSQGLPSDKPKGLIELVQVGDNGSVGRIVRTNKTSDPIRYQDYIYSAVWSANRPQRFALVGKIDIDRDGRDDREDLKRLIVNSGGVIDYDLPPAGVGHETGELTGLTNFYVTDDRRPIRSPSNSAANEGIEDQEFLKKRSKVLEEARTNGVQPISVERLLAYLGYAYGAQEPGRVEAIDRESVRSLMRPRQATPPPAGGGAAPANANPAAPPAGPSGNGAGATPATGPNGNGF